MKRNGQSLLLITVFVLTLVCSCKVSDVQSDSGPISHRQWDLLLNKHVDAQGWVDYTGFKADSLGLASYLDLISSHHPNEKNWSINERKAYWINAYNAFTIQLVAEHYPTTSIKNIKKGIPFVNSVWDIKFIEIEGQSYDLNNLEHGILRPKFSDPRIHFAVNCASYSCPPLANSAFTAAQLEDQLDHVARRFINDPLRNQITISNHLKLSKIFSWFKGDFTKNENLLQFITRYTDLDIESEAKIEYLDYNWAINDQKSHQKTK